MGDAAIVLDVGRGEARLGQTTVEIRSVGVGRLRVGGSAGPVLRPLTWGERLDVVGLALASGRARESLAEQIRVAATVSSGDCDAVVCEVLGLHLAGAGEPAPPFGEAAIEVVRATGWDSGQLAAAEAREIDRLASALAPEDGEAGWRVFLLGATELVDLRAALADDLLARGERRVGQREATRRRSGDSIGPPVRPRGLDADADTVADAEPRIAQLLEREVARRSGASAPAPLAPAGGAGRPQSDAAPPRSARNTVSVSRPVAPLAARELDLSPSQSAGDTVLLAERASRPGPTVMPPGRFARLAPAASDPFAPVAWPHVGEPVTATPLPRPREHLEAREWNRRPQEAEVESLRRGDTSAVGVADAVELADALAALLDDEADLRGLRR